MTDISVHSIFNDVLGPILAGPSSSHSGGCARIGLAVRNLFGREIKKAVVVFDAAGSYPSTYIGQGSNFGFTGGLLGMKTDNAELKNSVQIAKAQGRDISFSQEMLSHTHPNEARIDVYDDDGNVEMNALTLSTGGGTFEITQLDGFPIFINGNCRLSFVKCSIDGVEKIKDLIQQEFSNAEIEAVKKETEPDENHKLLIIKGLSEEQEQSLDKFSAHTEIISIRHSGKILPVSMKPADNEPIFHNAAGALKYSKEHSLDAADLAITYEMSVGRTTKEEVMELAKHTYDIMRHAATTQPDPKTETRFGFMPYQCKDMLEKKKSGSINLAPTGCLDQALFYAVSVMENSCAHNTVVASPTAGSSGVVPAAVMSVAEAMNLSEDMALKGLLASGLVGAFIANHATFGAEVAGCQAENGAASAMAAGGIVCMLGGSVEQSFRAASMALQNMLGLICDPVGGLTEIPCISRNVSAVSNAITSANMAVLGFDPMIPLDETIDCMLRVGQALPESLRCTCTGGLCVTPTGKCLGNCTK